MKIAYFDCSSGIAGNMIVGALIDAGVGPNYLRTELNKLQSSKLKAQNKSQIQISKVKRGLISGTYLNVKIKRKEEPRSLSDILTIIKMSKLSKFVKDLSTRIFKRLAKAEAEIHDQPIDSVHFHEVGAVDAIVDIVGTAIGIEKLGIEKIYCSPLPHGKGPIKHRHGILSNPAPATAKLLKGVPTYGTNVPGELVTPTGAAIISTLAEEFKEMPRMKVENIGHGAGSKIFPGLPNLLRVFTGEAELPTKRDAILKIETNIDDMNPRLYDQAIAGLMEAGALDAFITNIRMKKQREAICLTVLCRPELKDKILNELFTQTTTLGARIYLVPREKLSQKNIKVRKARVKQGFLGKELKTIAPEYEDYKRIAEKHAIPIQTVYQEIKRNSYG